MVGVSAARVADLPGGVTDRGGVGGGGGVVVSGREGESGRGKDE